MSVLWPEGMQTHPIYVQRERETRHLDRLGELGEFKQESNTGSEQEGNTGAQCVKIMRLNGERVCAKATSHGFRGYPYL